MKSNNISENRLNCSKVMLGVAAIILSCGSARAADYYVSPAGNDSNDGLGPTSARSLKTLQKAADKAVNPGDNVFVLPGTYTSSYSGSDVLQITKSGTAEAPITFKAYYSWNKPKIKLTDHWHAIIVVGASHIIIDGFEIEGNNDAVTKGTIKGQTARDAYNQGQPYGKGGEDHPYFSGDGIAVTRKHGGKTVDPPHNIKILNNKIYKCGGTGISISGSDAVTIEGNEVFECAWYNPYGESGISIGAMENVSPDSSGFKNFIRYNKCYRNQNLIPWRDYKEEGYPNGKITDGNGIIIDGAMQSSSGVPYRSKTLVANNVVYHNGGSGIHSIKSANVYIVNNTAYENGQTDKNIFTDQANDLYGEIYAILSQNVYIHNNILKGVANKQLTFNTGNTNCHYSNNLYFNGRNNPADVPGTGFGDINGQNPKFLSTTGVSLDLRLQAGSPAIDKGTDAHAPADDFIHSKRHKGRGIDIGAYESY